MPGRAVPPMLKVKLCTNYVGWIKKLYACAGSGGWNTWLRGLVEQRGRPRLRFMWQAGPKWGGY